MTDESAMMEGERGGFDGSTEEGPLRSFALVVFEELELLASGSPPMIASMSGRP